MNPKNSLVTVGFVVGWLIFVISGVRLVDTGLNFWRAQEESLGQAQEQFRRLSGWLSVEKKVAERRDQVLGPFAHSAETDLGWIGFQGFQELAKQQGVAVVELRPSRTPGYNRQPSRVQLDAKVEGQVQQLGEFLQKLPEIIPGVHLEDVQVMPQEGGRVQGLFRIRLQEVGRSR